MFKPSRFKLFHQEPKLLMDIVAIRHPSPFGRLRIAFFLVPLMVPDLVKLFKVLNDTQVFFK